MGEQEDEEERRIARMGRRLRKAPHMRRFGVYGWTVVLLPLDVLHERWLARMYFGTFYGFEPEQMCELRARQLKRKKKPARTWWVFAIRNEVFEPKLSERGREAWLKTSEGGKRS